MTLQIKELSVKIKVTEDNALPAAQRQASFTREDKEVLIEECIERVLEKIELQNQR
ncbi:MAG: DUF5908 family protein [Cyclobacteriaceae bacterium]